jgi:ABC-2 type transport system permease protein
MRMLYATSETELQQGIEQARKILGGSLLQALEANQQKLFELREEVPRIFAAIEGMEDQELAQQWIGSARSDRYVRKEVPGGAKEMQRLVDQGELFAYFVIGPDPVKSKEGFRYVANNQTDDSLRKWLAGHATSIVREKRVAQLGLTEERAKWLNEPVRFVSKKIDATTGEETEVAQADMAMQWAPVAFVYLLWISVFVIAQMLLTNTIEEKSNRIIEVLLSSVSPLQLMTGKILGIAMTGLTMVGSWAAFFVIAVLVGPLIWPQMGDVIGSFGLAKIATNPLYIGSFIVYFALGYLFFSSLLVGIGSVCNTLKEAQNLMQPIMIVLMLPLLAMIPVARDPNGLLAQVLSYFPPMTPFVMMNRVGGPPQLWEYAVTTAILLVSIWVLFRGAAKVFRIGILMTGKRPTLREMLRWIRAPIGAMPEAK